MNIKVLKNYLPLIIVVLVAIFLRFLWLDKIPNGISGDELTYVINSKAMWLSGSDISGNWSPLSVFIFKYPAYTIPQAELPYFLLAPFVGPFSFSLFIARFPYAVLSVLIVVIIYFITKELFGKEAGFLSAIATAINPWLIYIGRTNYESTPTVLFFLISILILLKTSKWKILLALPFLFAAFYSYIGTKLIFLPFVLIMCVYSYYFVSKKKYLKQYLILFAACLILVLFFAFSISHGISRVGELFFPNNPVLTQQVDEIRKVSVQSPLTNIFENKITLYIRILITKLFKSFSADYLFVSGDNFFSIIRHGMFYVLDAFFLLIGFAKIYQGKKSKFWLLLILIFVSTLPQLFHTAEIDNFVYHLSLMFPFITIVIGVGIWEMVNLIKRKDYFYASSAIIFLLYGFLVLNFLNIYFFQWPLRGTFDFDLRVFSKYAFLSQDQKVKIDVYSQSASDIAKKYIFYTNSFNKNSVSQIRLAFKNEEFTFGNLTFKGCNNAIDPSKSKNVVIYEFSCGSLKKDYSHKAISRLSDGGQNFQIYNDKTCSQFSLKPYPSSIKISDFSIENMSKKQFCETYISNL